MQKGRRTPAKLWPNRPRTSASHRRHPPNPRHCSAQCRESHDCRERSATLRQRWDRASVASLRQRWDRATLRNRRAGRREGGVVRFILASAETSNQGDSHQGHEMARSLSGLFEGCHRTH
jgi:hypothetical protein